MGAMFSWLAGSIYQLLSAYIASCVKWIGVVWSIVLATAVGLFLAGWEYLYCLVADFLVFFVRWAESIVVQNGYTINFSADQIKISSDILEVANVYIPFGVILPVVFSYYSVAFLVWGARHLVKLIPTVG